MPSLIQYYFYRITHSWLSTVVFIFWLWMLIDALRRSEWFWAVWMFIFPGLSSVIYFFLVYRAASSATQGFELPGAANRKRIKELEGLIHNLDKPHHYLELGDIYFSTGNLVKAEQCYRSSLERDPGDLDARSHLGQCLLRQKKAGEARPLLEAVCQENPEHEYGYSLMALAETFSALAEPQLAITVWQQVLASHSYARARVQLAELYAAAGQTALAAAQFRETLSDDSHAPGFQRKRDRFWIKRARHGLRGVS